MEEATKDHHSPGAVLDFPNLDSLNSEFRFYEWGFGAGECFLQITQDKSGKWNYRISYISEDSLQRIKTFEESTKNIDWKKLWVKLDSLDIRSISDQSQLKLVLTRDDGSKVGLKTDRYFEQIMDGDYYYMEWYDTSGYQEISYDNPFSYNKSFKKAHISDGGNHERFNQAVLILNEYFDLKNTHRQVLLERMDYYQKGKKKKRKTSK